MKVYLAVLLIVSYLIACSNEKSTFIYSPLENENPNTISQEVQKTSDYEKIFERKTSILNNQGNELFVIEKDKISKKIRILFYKIENDSKVLLNVEDVNSFNPMFAIDKPFTLYENTKYLDYLNNSVGFYDLDGDGLEEFFFVFRVVHSGIIIMDFVDNILQVTQSIYNFDNFYKIDNNMYVITINNNGVPPVLDLSINKYEVFLIQNNNLKTVNVMPDAIHHYYYTIIINKPNFKFEYLFFYLYNNRQTELNNKFVDDNFKSDPRADNKYKSKENVSKLVIEYLEAGKKSLSALYNFNIIDTDIYKTKYLYYYLIDTIK